MGEIGTLPFPLGSPAVEGGLYYLQVLTGASPTLTKDEASIFTATNTGTGLVRLTCDTSFAVVGAWASMESSTATGDDVKLGAITDGTSAVAVVNLAVYVAGSLSDTAKTAHVLLWLQRRDR